MSTRLSVSHTGSGFNRFVIHRFRFNFGPKRPKFEVQTCDLMFFRKIPITYLCKGSNDTLLVPTKSLVKVTLLYVVLYSHHRVLPFYHILVLCDHTRGVND